MTSPYLSQEELELLVDIAKEAGEAIMDIYMADERGIELKDDNSPLTAADLASHNVICRRLKQTFPDIPVMSEESNEIPFERRSAWSEYWLVDPLDGTKEFINRNGEFTVNIALIVDGQAVAGVVYVPVTSKCYVGELTQGARVIHQGETVTLVGNTAGNRAPVVVGSRSHPSPELAGYLERLGEHTILPVGSSLKFCMLAEGKADLYPRLGPTSEWDTAAAQAVLESAGGLVVDYVSGEPLRYNSKESVLNPWFVACAPGVEPVVE